jgi:hypothetical protein
MSVKDIRNDTGEATITLNRLPDAPGVSGAGTMANLSFVALAKGTGTLAVTEAAVKDTKGAAIGVALGNLNIAVE